MKKTLVLSVSMLLVLSSCGSYTGMGAYTGGSFGSIIGSAIGGIAGGPRGSDIGTLIGMAGGAAVGAAVGAAADNAKQRQYEDYRATRSQRNRSYNQDDVQHHSYDNTADQSGIDLQNSGDDRLIGFDENFNSTVPPVQSNLEIRNARIIDANRDGILVRGEEARMVFEVFNNSDKPAFRVLPSVTEVSGNKHIHISENVLVECIMPGKGIRYTAAIRADSRLKDGNAVIKATVFQNNLEVSSQAVELPIQTSKR